MPRHVRFGHRAWALLVVTTLALVSGCGQTRRTMTIESNPPGALVIVNGVEKGRTPVTFEFVWYGDYRFELSKDGYETLKDHRRVRAPAHEWVGIDLLKDVFLPATFEDPHTLHFTLTPMAQVAEADLIKRADELRDETLHAEK